MGSMYELSPHPQWVDTLHEFIHPYWEELLNSEWAQAVSEGRMTVPEMQGWILQIYPFIHAFPKFLAEGLIKVEDDYARSFLIDNIRVEKAHAEHWLWMGQGFGVNRKDMLDLAEGNRPLLRDVQSLTDWLWYINTKGTLAEAMAATSFAIEGITGDLSRRVVEGFESYRGRPGVDMNPKTYKWMREHARYDDEHPKVALEVVKRYATKRSLQLMHLALHTSYRAYSVTEVPIDVPVNNRVRERRKNQRLIGFPERRFGERRGRQKFVA
jgi:pyrroloquinoline quinone (PQQ) biosynthesis protein C